MVTETIDIVTRNVVKYMIKNRSMLCTAESCTGGMVAQTVTAVSGASQMFAGGICCYSEKMKMKLLGVRKQTLDKYSVYSKEVAGEMSAGALEMYDADYAVGITGIAGPGGGTVDKPVGTVYVSVRSREAEIVKEFRLYEEYEEDLTREKIRSITTLKAMLMLCGLFGIPESEVLKNGNV